MVTRFILCKPKPAHFHPTLMSGDDNELVFHVLAAKLVLRPRMCLVIHILKLFVYKLGINVG